MDHEPVYFNTLERQTTWKQGFPAQVLTAGMLNSFTLRFAEYPGAATRLTLPPEAKFCMLTIRDIPMISKVRIKVDPIEIQEGATEIAVSFPVSDKFYRGYYRMQVVLADADGNPVKLYDDGYAVVDKAVNPRPDTHVDLNSIRAEMADIKEEDNKLLDSLEVSTGDIAAAVHRCLEQWNTRAPRTSTYVGWNFPYTDVLRSGVVAALYRSLVAFLSRNKMLYQSGDVSIDLEARMQSYQQLEAMWTQRWIGGMAQRKNEEDMFGFTGYQSYI